MKSNFEKQSVSELVFNPMLYFEYPYHWTETDEKTGITTIIFSKKPRYTLLEVIEMQNKIKKIDLFRKEVE